MDEEEKKIREAAEQLDAAEKIVQLLKVLPPNMWGKSLMTMMVEHGEGNATLQMVGIKADDLLHLKVASFIPEKTGSREGFTLKAIAVPCAVFIAQQASNRLGQAINQVERVTSLMSSHQPKT